jgi:hypothetical protein
MFVFGNQKLPDSSPSFTPFRGRETSREKCKKNMAVSYINGMNIDK